MNETLKSWWRTRTLREQRLLLAMAGLLAVVLAWLLIIRPLNDALSAARERHGAAVVAAAEARAQARTIAQLEEGGGVVAAGAVDMLVTRSAADAGFTVARVDRAGPNRVTVLVNPARPQAVFGWVAQMEQRHGLIVERLSANTNSDQTLAVEVTFRGRGG